MPNQPNNEFIPSGPSPVELTTVDHSLQREREEEINQPEKKEIEIPQKDIRRHSIQFPLQSNLNEENKIERSSTINVSNNPLSQLLKPQITLTKEGDRFRATEQQRKLSNAQTEGTQTTIKRRNSL